MSKYSFEIKTSAHMLKKLIEDYDEFDKNPLSSCFAINCAMTSWHLVDWTLIEFESKHGFPRKKIKEYRKWLYKKCQSLSFMADVANGSKHFKLSCPESNITGTDSIQG